MGKCCSKSALDNVGFFNNAGPNVEGNHAHPSGRPGASGNYAHQVPSSQTSPLQSGSGKKGKKGDNLRIDINTASLDELMEIPMIGQVLAQRIIDLRPYQKLDDLKQVPGIGESKFESLAKCIKPLPATNVTTTTVGVGAPFLNTAPAPGTTALTEVQMDCREVVGDLRANLPYKGEGIILIASWNVRNLSVKSRTPADLKRIAAVIDRFDVIALQEVRDEDVVQELCKLLPGWGADISAPVGRGAKNQHQKIVHTERYAFMFRLSRVALLRPGRVIQDPKDGFFREPFLGSFSALPSAQHHSKRPQPFDFVLVNIHVTFTDKEKRSSEILQLGKLLNTVTKALERKGNDIILLGDFNTPPDKCDFGGSWLSLISKSLATTLGGSLYDNIWIHNVHTLAEFSGACGVYRFDREPSVSKAAHTSLRGNNGSTKDQDIRKQLTKMMSDHLPVWAAFHDSSDDNLSDAFGSLRLSQIEYVP